ncbi:hypothetical protein ACIA8C_12970 [Nocardia sp. NPDC051321]|uniref:hypothetical protein n=1 Tax=Nocardia sp. NPDC051321 TaxID=3364323 RepID=UPI00379348C3
MTDPQPNDLRPEDSAADSAIDIGFTLGKSAAPSTAPPADTGETAPAAADANPGNIDADADAQPSEPQADDAHLADPADEQATENPAPELLTIEQQATELAHRIARELGASGPEGWQHLQAFFSLTIAGGVAYILYYDDDDQVSQTEPPAQVSELVRLHRDISAGLGDGPWWRMLIDLDQTGEVEVDYDYADEPFPDDQLLPADAYRADLEAFPRERVPVWLAAYIFHDERQWRSPTDAAAQARADRDAGITSTLSRDDFPPLPVLWARWATIAAAFVAVGSELGPRIRPALGIFEGATRSGATLFILPGGRAVLSGGLWNAPDLDAAYNADEPLPDLYAGAPDWVANQVLNPRAAQGQLSFCYWWERGSWHRGESPDAAEFSAAVPGVWSAQTVADILCAVLGDEPTEHQRDAAATLVAAAETGVVTRDTVTAFFDNAADNVDAAFYQLNLAGLTVTDLEPLPQNQAITLVRDYILELGVDTTGYPLDELVAERLDVGWMVFVPTEPGEIAIGRAIFYIADDGVIEQSSSSTAPSLYAEGFEQRFRERGSASIS